jgi:hypothetical protein
MDEAFPFNLKIKGIGLVCIVRANLGELYQLQM